MGNCCRRATTWADDEEDEWDMEECEDSERFHQHRNVDGEEMIPLRRNERSLSEEAEAEAASATEVKVKISKKQLEKLLHQVDVQGLPVQEVVSHLLESGGGYIVTQVEDHHHNHHAWKPALQSIPESPEQIDYQKS